MADVRQLIDAIQSGKSAVIQSTFDQIVTEKIQNGIAAYRQAVIENTFNPEMVSESTVENESNIDEEFDLSEYTLEEIQEFMESEDFDSLDELSKKTLGAYAKKATNLALQHSYIAGGGTGKPTEKDFKTALKRQKGVNTAIKKLVKD